MDDDARARFRSRWRELLEGDPTKSRIYKDMGNGVATAGIEYYLPLFFEETATVFDYLGERRHGGAARRPGAGLPALLAGHARPLPPGAGRPRAAGAAAGGAVPERRAVLRAGQRSTRSWRCAAARRTSRTAPSSRSCRDLSRGARRRGPAGALQGAPAQHTPHRVLVLAESDGRRESLLDFLRASQLSPARLRFAGGVPGQRREAGHRHRGAGQRLRLGRSTASTSSPRPSCSPPAPTTRRRKKQEQVSDVEALIKDLSELNVGDPVVHAQHGIGRYRGLVNMDLGQGERRRHAAAAGVPAPGIRRQGHAVRAGEPAAPDQPLHRRRAPTRRRCTSWAPASGKRPSARPPSRCATPPPSC